MLFHAIAPHLKTEKGHNLSYHDALEEAVKRLGLSYQGWTALECLLKHPKRSPFFKKPQFLTRLVEFNRLLCSTQNQKNIFFIESFKPKEFIAFAINLLLFAGPNDHFIALFRYGLPQYRKKWLLLLFIKLMTKRLGSRFSLLTDSELIAETFNHRIKNPITVMPIPHTEKADETENKNLTFWWPGPPRSTKGFLDIQKLLHLHTDSSIEIVASEAAHFQKGEHITLRSIPHTLSREEYLRQMASSSVILLPYDPKTYQFGTSGILVEAIIAGKMPLVKEGSWLAHELKKFQLDELIVNFEDPHFFSNALTLLHNESIKHKLQKMQEAYCQYHSIEMYAQELRKILKH